MEKKIKIDLSRHLCDTCKKANSCEFDSFEVGEYNNIIRCKKYYKNNLNVLKPRAAKGEPYWTYSYIDERNPKLGYKPYPKIEKGSRSDNLTHEFGSYFLTEADCFTEIARVSKLKGIWQSTK